MKDKSELTLNLSEGYGSEVSIMLNTNYSGTAEPASFELRSNVSSVLENSLLRPFTKLSGMASDVMKSSNSLLHGVRKSQFKRFVANGPLFTSLRTTTIACPEHLKGDITTYINVINDLQSGINDLLPKAINALKAEVAIMSRGKDGLSKAKRDFGVTLPVVKWQGKLKSVLDTKTSKDRCEYGQLVSRNKDWIEVEAGLHTLATTSAGFDIKETLKGVDTLTKNITYLVETKLSDSQIEANALTITSLGKAVHELSEAVSLSGIVAGLVIELSELETLWSKRFIEISNS